MVPVGVRCSCESLKDEHHVPHCAVDKQVLECRVQCSVLVMETAYCNEQTKR